MYVNAWQAMPDGGKLYLETSLALLNDRDCKPHQIGAGRYGKLSITDTGIGMNDATCQRIFDPFFTTKEKGRGTGLGLASAYGIIKNHGGMIAVHSQLNHGTTFDIYLPLSDKQIQSEVETEAGLKMGDETILLVDDEEMIIDVGQALLEKMGYRAVAARGGKEAIALVKKMGSGIDLVILDLIMPEMDGGEVFDQIRKIRPELPIILSSGYAINDQAEKIMQRGCDGFIQKPFNITDFSNQLRKVLDGLKDSDR
jgi:CheY-like chemotaxis protein